MILTTDRLASPVADDFWVASGHHLVDRGSGGGLIVTDAFLRAYLARPELLPPDEACPVERGLHAALLAMPGRSVEASEIALIADADARENFSLFLSFRDHLNAHPTLESAYLALIRGGMARFPPLFLQHLTHVIARNAFDEVSDPFILRIAECFFRPQRLTLHEGALLLADADVIERHEQSRDHSPLLKMLGGPAVSELEILNAENGHAYRARSDAHDFVLEISSEMAKRALGAAMRRWISHLLAIDIEFTPVERLAEARFSWFLALDAAGSALGNKVWHGAALSESEAESVLALFTFALPAHPRLDPALVGAPGFAILGAQAERIVRIKPQNLIAGLPLLNDPG